MKKFLLLFLFIVGVCVSNFAFAGEMLVASGQNIKVAISNDDFSSILHKEITLSATKPMQIYDTESKNIVCKVKPNFQVKVVMKHGFFDVYIDEQVVSRMLSGPLSVTTEKDGFLSLDEITRKGEKTLYRGFLSLDKVKSRVDSFYIINILNIQDYLYGVVPNEMPVRFGLEALKAQAVAARNYVLRPRTNSSKNNQYDVTDSVSSQVYFGANTEEPVATKAVDETENIVAMNNEEIILALYHSTSGGITESYENAFNRPGTRIFPANPLPYLKAVKDYSEMLFLEQEEDAINFYKSVPESFENESPYFRWTKSWTVEELSEVLNTTLKKYINSGYVAQMMPYETAVGELKEIKVLQRGKSGKVVKMSIVGTKNVFMIEKELIIRQIFLNENKILPSANVVFEHVVDENGKLKEIIAYGGGYGHGVGMSQYGAGYLAKIGKTFSEILNHYYSSINLATIPVSINTNKKNHVEQRFYSPDMRANLIVKNLRDFDNISVNINNKETILITGKNFHTQMKYELTPYINSGLNIVKYEVVKPSSFKNEVQFHIEFLNEDELSE